MENVPILTPSQRVELAALVMELSAKHKARLLAELAEKSNLSTDRVNTID